MTISLTESISLSLQVAVLSLSEWPWWSLSVLWHVHLKPCFLVYAVYVVCWQLAVVPDNFDKTYLTMARQGARVLALGHRRLGMLSYQQVCLRLLVCHAVSRSVTSSLLSTCWYFTLYFRFSVCMIPVECNTILHPAVLWLLLALCHIRHCYSTKAKLCDPCCVSAICSFRLSVCLGAR